VRRFRAIYPEGLVSTALIGRLWRGGRTDRRRRRVEEKKVKITAIIPWLVKAKASYWGEFLFVEVRTDEGISGWGEITTTTKPANRAVAAILRQLNELLVGDDPSRIEAIWHKTFRAFTYMGSRGATTHVVSGIDIALWDLMGKARNLPIYDMLGGPVRDDILIYTHPDQRKFKTREGVVAEIREIVDSGHTSIKFDPFPYYEGRAGSQHGYLDGYLGKKGEHEAAELTALIRETAGPDVELLIDAHGRFDVPNAIRLCRALEDAGQIDWFEEPVPVESYHALRQVREKVNAAISVGERLHTRWEFVPILEKELADYIMPDVTWTGGISELKKIATLAESYYVPITPHDASGPINIVAGAQVMLTVPNFYRLETSSYDLSGYNELIETPLDNSGGRLKLGDGPGLGITMNLDYLRGNFLDGFGDSGARG
jgi:galactonate dehydratase